MNCLVHTRLSWLSVLALALTLTGSFGVGGQKLKSGTRPSDPRLSGSRDMNYDHLIIAGDRIGPVKMGGLVSDAVSHLGNPDKVLRSTFRGPGYPSDEVHYWYKEECIEFVWMDSGINPTIEDGFRGLIVTCGKWSTPSGLRVGSSMQDSQCSPRSVLPIQSARWLAPNRNQGGYLVRGQKPQQSGHNDIGDARTGQLGRRMQGLKPGRRYHRSIRKA